MRVLGNCAVRFRIDEREIKRKKKNMWAGSKCLLSKWEQFRFFSCITFPTPDHSKYILHSNIVKNELYQRLQYID